jgi:hypothetical protein
MKQDGIEQQSDFNKTGEFTKSSIDSYFYWISEQVLFNIVKFLQKQKK